MPVSPKKVMAGRKHAIYSDCGLLEALQQFIWRCSISRLREDVTGLQGHRWSLSMRIRRLQPATPAWSRQRMAQVMRGVQLCHPAKRAGFGAKRQQIGLGC
jgi:hypothetical protein